MMNLGHIRNLDRRKSALVAAASTIALFASAGAAHAQDAASDASADTASTGLGDIVVTAQRRTESINSVPIAISAIDAESITEQNVTGIDDVFNDMPNVSFVSQGSRDRKEISIRGISNQLDAYRASRQQAYAFYIDEYNVAVGTSNPEILDIDRIEVLRGPQGTYFGRNSVGGAINITTKKPNDEWFAEVGGGYSSFDTRKVHGIINVPVVEGLLAVRASGELRATDGNIKNINEIGGGSDGTFKTGRITARVTPNDRLTWDTTYSYSTGKQNGFVGVPSGFNTATWASLYYGEDAGFVADEDGIGFYPENDDEVNFNRATSVGTEFEYVSSRLEYEFDDMTLTAVAGTLDNHIYNEGDVDGGSVDAFYEYRNINRSSTSGELRLQSNGPRAIEWSIGANVGQDKGDLSALTYNGTENPIGMDAGSEITAAISNVTNDYWAVFGQATWNATDSLKLIVGGRYSWEKTHFEGIRRSAGVLTDTNDRSATFDDFSPRFTVSYEPMDLGMFYATVSKGFKAGGVQNTSLENLDNQYKPETLWNYELGWKGDFFDRRLRVNAAAFYMDWKDVQQYIQFQYLDDDGLLRSATAISNASSATSKGVELSVEGLVTDQLRIGGDVGYLDAKYDDYANALIDGTTVDATGMRLVNSPKWSLNAHAEYRRDIKDGMEGFARAEWMYRSGQLTSSYAYLYKTWPFITKGYDVTNLRAGVSTDRWDLTVYVENLFKADYFNSSYEQAFYSGVQIEPSVRTFGVDVRFRFGAY